MVNKISPNASLSPALPPLTELQPPDTEGVRTFNAVLGTLGEPNREVTDEELRKAIGASIMTKIINDTFDDLRKFKDSLR